MRQTRTTARPFPSQAQRNVLQVWLEVPALARLLPVPRGGRVLEVGCGRGVALAPLSRLLHPSGLVGLDVDESLLREAAPPTGVELVHGDVRSLPFASAAFDVVVDFGTVHHLDEPVPALREIARVLAPGGVFVHETRLAQLLAHPVRARRRALPWAEVPELERDRSALLWAQRRRAAEPTPGSLSFRN